MSSFTGGWGGSPCVINEELTVSGFPANRSTWKEELGNDKCGDNIVDLVTVINHKQNERPYYVGFRAKDDKSKLYLNKDYYKTIEQSLKIKNL